VVQSSWAPLVLTRAAAPRASFVMQQGPPARCHPTRKDARTATRKSPLHTLRRDSGCDSRAWPPDDAAALWLGTASWQSPVASAAVAAVGSACAKHTLHESDSDGPAVYVRWKERARETARCAACTVLLSMPLLHFRPVLGVAYWVAGPSRSTALENDPLPGCGQPAPWGFWIGWSVRYAWRYVRLFQPQDASRCVTAAAPSWHVRGLARSPGAPPRHGSRMKATVPRFATRVYPSPCSVDCERAGFAAESASVGPAAAEP